MTKKLKLPIEKLLSHDFLITSAVIKDELCHYSFDIIYGVGMGDTHAVKGKGIVMESLKEAFQKLNVHMAVIDDVFKHNKIDISNIDKFHNNELSGLYTVNGFKIKGGSENESVTLIGTKYVTSAGGGRIELETPKVALDSLSSYQWYNELKEAIEHVRKEVESYKDGNYISAEPEVEKENPKQMKITDNEKEFETAKV